MKKFKKGLKSLLALAVISLGLVGCGNTPPSIDEGDDGDVITGPGSTTIVDAMDSNRPSGEDFDYVTDYVQPEPPEVSTEVTLTPDPAYESGGATTKTRMEAENALINYKNSTSEVWKNSYSDVYNLAFDFRLSNNLATRNLNNSDNTTLTFNYNSDKSYMVKLNMMISVWDDKRCPFTVGDYITLTTKGVIDNELVYNEADLSKTVIEWDDTEILVDGGDVNPLYWHFKEVQIEVALFKGENNLVIEMIGQGGANIDYIEFDTSATVTGFDSNHYMEDGENASRWYVSKYPTDTEAGTISVEKYIAGDTRKYTYGLPKFKDEEGNLTKGYSEKDLGNGETCYTFKFKKGEIDLNLNKKSTVTLKDYPNVSFANGLATLEKKIGSTLEYSDFAPIAGGRLVSKFNVYDSNNSFIGTAIPGEWVFIEQNVTMEAVSYVREGFTMLDPGNEQNTRLPQVFTIGNDGKGTSIHDSNFTNTSKHSNLIKGDNGGFAELGSVIGYNGTMPQGFIFRVNSKVDANLAVITMGVEHQFAYNFENKGENRIHLKLNQINSNVYIEDGDAGVEIDLEPGESVSILVKIKFAKGSANKNALTRLETLSECVNMKLGMSMSCKLGS